MCVLKVALFIHPCSRPRPFASSLHSEHRAASCALDQGLDVAPQRSTRQGTQDPKVQAMGRQRSESGEEPLRVRLLESLKGIREHRVVGSPETAPTS